MAREDAMIVTEFSKVVKSHLQEVLAVLPVLVPQTNEDKVLFKKGAENIAEIIYGLEHAETVRDMGRYIDIQKVVRDFDVDSIKSLNLKINTTARESVVKLGELIDGLEDED